MILRLAVAYGVVHAVTLSAVLTLASVLLGQQTVGVTRQPLPLTWPLGVIMVVVAQIPLRDVLGAMEVAGVNARRSRAARTVLTSLLVLAGVLTHVGNGADPPLVVLLMVLAAAGLAAAALTPLEPWAVTAGTGMVWLGLQFLTPFGATMGLVLHRTGAGVAAVLGVAAATAYVVRDRPLRAWPGPPPGHG